MFLKPNLIIFSHEILTIWLFVAVGVFLFIFLLWYEGKKDGFDVARLIDLGLLQLALAFPVTYLISLWYRSLQIYHYNSFFLKFDQLYMTISVYGIFFFLLIYIYAKKFNWSKYRLLDIFAISGLQILVMWLVGEVILYRKFDLIILIVTFYLLHVLILKDRGKKFLSGYGFSAFLFTNILSFALIFKRPGYLLFTGLLATISLLIVYFRRKNSMANTNLTSDFLKFIREKLNIKEKQLRAEESLIKKEDPYLQPGRDTGNSESMDEAVLEDTAKELSDAQLNRVQGMQKQTRRAISSMKAGKYGTCEICGKPIDKARLEVYPEATKCVDCSSKSE